ncbi:MAG: tetratricopeptide repeat-containing protein, partial [Spirochaetales bacterium]|nr:tetratricopeptide repeat-containing protein [Spirochaetales bacterium]
HKITFTIIIIFFLFSCSSKIFNTKDFVLGTKEQQAKLNYLFSLLEKETNYDNCFILNKEISKILEQQTEKNIISTYLLRYIEAFPSDPYNAWYTYKIAENYKHQKINSFAEKYYLITINNFNDIIHNDKSIHLATINNLIEINKEPEFQIELYLRLERDFPESMKSGINLYNLAKTYEKTGEFKNAIATYQKLIELKDKDIPGGSNNFDYIKEMLSYQEVNNVYWVKSDLNSLTNTIRYAIRTQNAELLRNQTSKLDFFVTSWTAEQKSVNREFISEFDRFIRGIWRGSVKAANELDNSSNNSEAYLRTENWSYRIGTWYMYFRKIDFPADQRIHDKWEWIGIYLGEKPFRGEE